MDATTNGTLYFDAFESRRSVYIGPVQSGGETTTTITYTYDPLYRLTEANYSDGRYFRYTYDSVGNRLTEEKCIATPCTVPITNTYVYDSANRLTSVNGQPYTWDDNGNLLNDGTSTYGYDAANRLTSVTSGSTTSSYTYNGLGDRLSQTVDSATTNYVLDMNTGLTQVLAQTTQPSNDPTTYLYGNGRIGELQPGGFAYHLGDALGSVRQLVDTTGGVTSAKAYEPYGSPLTGAGTGSSVFAFAGEQVDSYIKLLYLRSRWLSTDLGRFTSRDTFRDYSRPLTLNGWGYVEGDPINLTDPSGHDPYWCGTSSDPEACYDRYLFSHQPRINARVYYLNQIGNTSGQAIQPGSNPIYLENYILFRVNQIVGPQKAKSIPIYTKTTVGQLVPVVNQIPGLNNLSNVEVSGETGPTRLQMFAEACEYRVWSPFVTNEISADLQAHPLAAGERVVIIGNSGGGTVAIEALDLLSAAGVFVDQVIWVHLWN